MFFDNQTFREGRRRKLGRRLALRGQTNAANTVAESTAKAESKALTHTAETVTSKADNVVDDLAEAAGDVVAPNRVARLNQFTDGKERAIAEYLEDLGQTVTKNPLEGVAGAGRQGDAFVNGVKHEFKTLDLGARPNTIKNAVNESIRGKGQAREIVIDARLSGLTEETAKHGTFKALGIVRGKLDGLTIIGDGFFFRYTPR